MKLVRVKAGKKVFFGGFVRKEGEEFFVPDDMPVKEGSNIILADAPEDAPPKPFADLAGEKNGPHDRVTAISAALSRLSKDNDNDWTNDGLPATDAVSKYAGFRVRRAEISATNPGLRRDM